MLKKTSLLLFALLLTAAPALGRAFDETERERDGLQGPVRRVRTETAKIVYKNGKLAEGERATLETATYDVKGAKVDNAYFLAAGGSLTGKEVYKYDERGNIVEMTLHNADGSVMSKEKYDYEFDAMGNWTKMVTSVALVENGQLRFEPTEVTYRFISYFLDERVAQKLQPASASAAPAAAATASNNPPAAAVKSNARPAPSSQPQAKQPPAPQRTAAPPSLSGAANMSASLVMPDKAPAASNVPAAAPVVKTEDDLPPARKVHVRPVSGGVLNGKAISLPKPDYPDAARRLRSSGMVTVEVVIDVNGRVISAKATSGAPLLRDAAERAAMQARFTPALLSGQPVKVSGQINYNFSL
ncbi:MAG TPA: TonB family protein [Pyrinomonadaceae bacterium]|nr:TonB family protein [Pyrinomonadaceae bacterium]